MRVVDLSEYGFEAARTPPLGHLSGPQAKMVLYRRAASPVIYKRRETGN